MHQFLSNSDFLQTRDSVDKLTLVTSPGDMVVLQKLLFYAIKRYSQY